MPESRQVTVTLPPGVPTGRVRLTVTVTDRRRTCGVGTTVPAGRPGAGRRVRRLRPAAARLLADLPGAVRRDSGGAVVAVGRHAGRGRTSRFAGRYGGRPGVHVGLVPSREHEVMFSGEVRVVGRRDRPDERPLPYSPQGHRRSRRSSWTLVLPGREPPSGPGHVRPQLIRPPTRRSSRWRCAGQLGLAADRPGSCPPGVRRGTSTCSTFTRPRSSTSAGSAASRSRRRRPSDEPSMSSSAVTC